MQLVVIRENLSHLQNQMIFHRHPKWETEREAKEKLGRE